MRSASMSVRATADIGERHDVGVRGAAQLVLAAVDHRLAIAGGDRRVRKQHGVAGGHEGVRVPAVGPGVPGSPRAAVGEDHQRVRALALGDAQPGAQIGAVLGGRSDLGERAGGGPGRRPGSAAPRQRRWPGRCAPGRGPRRSPEVDAMTAPPATDAEEKARSCSGPPTRRRGAGSSTPPIQTEPRPWSSLVAMSVVSSSHTGSTQWSSSGHTGVDVPSARSSSSTEAARLSSWSRSAGAR